MPLKVRPVTIGATSSHIGYNNRFPASWYTSSYTFPELQKYYTMPELPKKYTMERYHGVLMVILWTLYTFAPGANRRRCCRGLLSRLFVRALVHQFICSFARAFASFVRPSVSLCPESLLLRRTPGKIVGMVYKIPGNHKRSCTRSAP